MATDAEVLKIAVDKLTNVLQPLGKMVDAWVQREQRPGLYTKIPVATPFRPFENACEVIAILAAGSSSRSMDDGLYDIIATADCFFSIGQKPALVAGGYPILARLVYGPVRLARQDIINVIATIDGGTFYLCKVE